jgi:predicted dehydrogenase
MTGARRVAIVGTGSRARLYTRGLAGRSGYAVAALCDPSPTRMAYHNRLLTSAGREAAAQWSPDGFARMLAADDITDVVVATVDELHDQYIVAAVEAGCQVVTEKPMTTDASKCRAILDATSRAGRSLTVAFNYRYNPVHERVWQLLREQSIGEVLSVHFEWLLDVRHGADYFRRWHREKARSGGLMVHKASHHFDLVNWWLGSAPQEVFGYGRLGFYGAAAGLRHGLRREYARAHGSAAAADDPFALDIAGNEGLRELYLLAEADSGYVRDRNVFDGDISIEDDMAVLVRYASGASMSYHLSAYSPWEGYRVMFNGSAGRLELEVTESAWQPRRGGAASPGGAIHGEVGLANAGGATIALRKLWERPAEVPVAVGHSGHGGGDERMLTALYGPADSGGDPSPGSTPPEPGDAARQGASERDGALALVVGAAANECFRTGRPVRTADLVPGLLLRACLGRAGVDRDHLVEPGQLEDPGHPRARADERQHTAVRAKPPVHPHDLMQRGRVDEREVGQVHQEQAGLLRGLRAQHITQFPGGDVGLADQPHHGGETAFAVCLTDGHRQLSHDVNYGTPG